MKDFLRWIRKHNKFVIITVIILFLSLALSLGYYYKGLNNTFITNKVINVCMVNKSETLSPYNEKEDKSFIMQLFKDNWYWLVAGYRCSYRDYVNNMLDNKTSSENPKDYGNLNIFTYRIDGQPVGFTAYYINSDDSKLENINKNGKPKFIKSTLLFLAIDKKYRGCGYGRKLLNLMINKLRSLGDIVEVDIFTRSNNLKALSLYKSEGFTELRKNKKYTDLIRILR